MPGIPFLQNPITGGYRIFNLICLFRIHIYHPRLRVAPDPYCRRVPEYIKELIDAEFRIPYLAWKAIGSAFHLTY